MDTRFTHLMPDGFFVDPANVPGLQRHLRALGWIAGDEAIVAVRKAGEGNMNLVLRVDLGWRTLILKQARPWVERYPDIDAPADRALVEAAFYDAVASSPAVSTRLPRLLGVDARSSLLCVEDLGAGNDLMDAYAGVPISDAERAVVARWLAALHALPVPDEPLLRNRDMRRLNHAHIFVVPLDPSNGVDLEARAPGLRDLADPLLTDGAFRDAVDALGQRYLRDGPALVHGDVYPGSFLRTATGLRVLDPEFAHTGEPAFDLGVFAAHLVLAGDGEHALDALLATYARPIDPSLTRAFAGVELMRRALGVARLPLPPDPARFAAWLDLSRRWVLGA